MKRIAFAAAALAIFTAVCWDASRRLPEENPSIPMCFADPQKYAGKQVWINSSPVLSAEAGSFDVRYWDRRIRILAPFQPPVGTHVMVFGTFQADQTVLSTRWLEESQFLLKRRGAQVVSLIVLAAVLLVFRRTFAWRDGAIHVRDPHSAAAPQKPLDGN